MQGAEDARRLVILAGSASRSALETCAADFEKRSGNRIELQFSGSGTALARLKLSRRGDLYIPGSCDYLAKAVDEGVVSRDGAIALAYLIPAILVQPAG